MIALIRRIVPYAFCSALAACGGDSSSSSNSSSSGSSGAAAVQPASSPTPELSYVAVKTFRFDWTDVADATHYKLLEDPDGASGYTQVGSDVDSGMQTVDHVVPLYKRLNARYLLQACNDAGCTDSAPVSVSGNLAEGVGYFKAGNTDAADQFGHSLSLSADGNTLAVGAPFEDSNATGIDGDQSDNGAGDSGAVYIFSRDNNGWSQQAYVKASNSGSGDGFGHSVSLSDYGDRLAVGAPFEDSSATGINSDQNDNSAAGAGAAYLFTRDSAGNWGQQLYIKASNTDAGDNFGHSISLSGNGTTLAVGAVGEDSAAQFTQDINGDEDDNSAQSAGAVYVFRQLTRTVWSKQAYIKTRHSRLNDFFGHALSLSADGNRLAVGMPSQDSDWFAGNESDDSAADSGAVYIFSRDNNVWSREAFIKVVPGESSDQFGWAVSLSGDGDRLAAGAPGANSTGTAYIFSRDAGWEETARINAGNTGSDAFGRGIALSADGSALAVGAPLEDSNAVGINGDQDDNSASAAGAVYLFIFDNIAWSQRAYIKAGNTDSGDLFSSGFYSALSLSADGNTLAVGAPFEEGNAIGINGDQGDDSAGAAGAVYLY